jgi:transposase
MLTVGIDPHKKTHTAVAVDEAGRRIGRPLTVADDPDAVAKLCAWAAKLSGWQPVRWAIEDGRGLARRLAVALLATGAEAVWVPVRLMVAARHLLPSRGKSDPIDAFAVARAALDPDNADYLAPVVAHEIGRDCAHLVAERSDRVAERTRTINTLRWSLHELGVPAPKSLTTRVALRQLTAALTALPETTLRSLTLRTCAELQRATDWINEPGTIIAEKITALCPNLLAVPGVGTITAATILGELGDPARVRSGAALARLAGTAPIPVWTSNKEQTRLDRGGNRKLNHAPHIIAVTQVRTDPRAQALIAKHQANKGKRGALRILKRHLTDVIYRELRTDINALTSEHTQI